MKAGRVVVDIELTEIEVEVGERVRPINDEWNAVPTSHCCQFGHRQDLACEVDHVRGQDHPGSRRDRFLEQADDLCRIFGGHRNLDLLQDDAFTALALLERALRIDPDSGEIYLALAKIYSLKGDTAMASATAQRGMLYCNGKAQCDALRAYSL